jgi:hypothetical protein
MSNIKVYEFEVHSSGLPEEWNAYDYFSKDLDISVRQPLLCERACLAAVLQQEGLASLQIVGIMSTYDLEKLLIDNNIYVKFIEGEHND